jgi:hypothetical protein
VTITDLLMALDVAGLRLANACGQLRVRGPAGAIVPALREALAGHKPALLAMLPTSPGRNGTYGDAASRAEVAQLAAVTISGQKYLYRQRWRGERMEPCDRYIAFDTETEVLDLQRQIPRLALATASAGENDNAIIHPDDVGAFIMAHTDLRFICHHAAFDFWTVEQHLRQRCEEDARRAWWDVAATNRLHDSLLLDMLLRLARDDSFPRPRDLAVVASEYADMEVSKEDPYRRRYVEIIGKPWAEVDEKFFEYAVKDPIVTRAAYLALRHKARELFRCFQERSQDILPDAEELYGPLTESVLVKKAIALAAITRNGLTVDEHQVEPAEAALRKQLADAVARLREICPDLYQVDREGNLKITPKGVPQKSRTTLLAQLANVRDEIAEETGTTPKIPLTGKSRALSTAREDWLEYQDLHPLLRPWIDTEELAKAVQFFGALHEANVHPRYSTFVRSGRSCASGPNVQQVPREGPFRQLFVASPGHFFLSVDYSTVELRTLAAHCLHRYGWSRLADVIRAGADPHAHTAAMMLEVPVEAFLQWNEHPNRRQEYANARQAAKPVNFGVPGGLGVESLVRYAKASYGVTMTADQARAMREKLITEVYPELALYLAEDTHTVLAGTLHTAVDTVRAALGDVHLASVRKILEGDPRKADGTPYQERFISQVWRILIAINRNPELAGPLERRDIGKPLAAAVCQGGVSTLTGRIRGRVRYSQARNTPFQGLAADGAGLALFALVREGYRVAAFIHDEVLIELPDEGGYVSEAKVRRVEEILCTEMASVMGCEMPVAVESALTRRWDKKAQLIVKRGKVYPWEPEGFRKWDRPT